MQIPFIKIFSLINICLSADCISDPIIEIQPRMNLKCISVNYDLCSGAVRNIPVMEWRSTSNSGLFIVELKFLVNYKNFLSHYTLSQQIVTLKKYKKKQTSDEKYDELLHAPHNISLPQENSNRTIFKVDIRVPDNECFLASNNINDKKNVISFQSSTHSPAKSISDIKKLNELLLSYMVDDIDELSNFGFQFFFKVIATADNGEVVSKTVVSDIFGFSHNEDLSYLTECLLNQDDFHMSPPIKDINVGKFCKFTKSFKRKKNKFEEETEKKSKCVIS